MKRVQQQALVLVIALSVTGALYAQQKNPKYEFGINLGFTVYQGDLTPERLGSFKTQKLSLIHI